MLKKLAAIFMMTATASVLSQTYDSSTLVDTNNNSTSTSTVTSTNTNNNTNNNINDTTVNSTATNTNINQNDSTSVNTNNNNNVNTSTSVNTNNNNNVNTTTSTNTNNNINSGEQTFNNNNVNQSTVSSDNKNTNVNSNTSTNRNINENTTKIEQPPPTAIAPSMMSGGNSDLCTTGTSGAVQTQILGVASGGTVRDLNCERLKNAKTLYDMGMKVAAVSTLCQDRRVFDAMWNAGTPCPYEGIIGERAKVAWNDNPDKIPKHEEVKGDDFYKKTSFGALLGYLLFIVF